MDLGSGYSKFESVEDNEAPDKLVNGEEMTNIKNNGSCAVVEHHDDQLLGNNTKGKGIEVMESVNSPPMGTKSASPRGTGMKGHGLKKWRRIKREVSKDGGSNVDSSKILKRGLSNSVANLTGPMHFSADAKEKSEGSVSSTNAMLRSQGAVVDGFVVLGDPEFMARPTFTAGTDSENSEDRSSKSSTAASAPKTRFDVPAGVGYACDKNRIRSVSGKYSANSVQKSQKGKGLVETSKKARGDLVKLEKENSHSSMESDLRSSNFVFMQGTNSMTSNGRQSGTSMNYDGENSDEAQGCERQFSEELETGYGTKDAGEFEDVSQKKLASDLSSEAKEHKSENHESSSDQDPLVASILALQSAQEALENEVQILKDIGQEKILVFDDNSLPSMFTSVDSEVRKPSSIDLLQCGESRQNSHSFKTQVVSLKQNVDSLERELEEAKAMLKMKEAKVADLEAIVGSSKPTMQESGSSIELEQEKYVEMEIELEAIFRQKIEAEVEYLAISRTIQNLRVAAVDQITLLEEQKTLALKQGQMLNKLGDAQGKAAMLKSKAEKLEIYCQEIVGVDEVLRLQKRIFKFTSCFFIQLMLLVVFLGLFVLKFSAHNEGVAPT